MLGLSDCCSGGSPGDGRRMELEGSVRGRYAEDPELDRVMAQQQQSGGCMGCVSTMCACGGQSRDQGYEPEARVLEPLIEERIVEVLKEEVHQTFVEVPEIQYLNKVVEVPQKVIQERIVEVPKAVYKERIKEVMMPVYEEKIVEVPEVKLVDRYEETTEYVTQEKSVEVPRFILREFHQEQPQPVIETTTTEKREYMHQSVEQYETIQEQTIQESVQQGEVYEKVVNVPHIQHQYRNVMTPTYRHVPKPVEVPMTHYRPIPIERIVDRNVPVPVELHLVQEYLCAKIEPLYKDVHVPVHVQRTIEHPVPREAMKSEHLLPLYYQGTVQGGQSYAMAADAGPPQNNAFCFPLPGLCGGPPQSQMPSDQAGQPAPIFHGEAGPIHIGDQQSQPMPIDQNNPYQMDTSNIQLDPNDPALMDVQRQMEQHMPPHMQQMHQQQYQQQASRGPESNQAPLPVN